MPVECCPENGLMNFFRRTPKPKRRWQEWPRMRAENTSGKDTLQIFRVDPCLKRNGFTHRTAMFDLMTTPDDPQLVVRRGQAFILELTLNRPYNKETDEISFIFYHKLAKYPSVGRKTMVFVPLMKSEDNSKLTWSAVIDKAEGNSISVLIIPSADAIIGKWLLEIDAAVKKQGSSTFKYKGAIYILFNAWCKEDIVYIDGAANRKEYVLTDVGLIWTGTVKKPTPMVWKYGQFDKDVLDCSLRLLDEVAKLTLPECNDPIKVARAVSAAVNRNDDNGVVVGNWSGDYSGGKKPTEWVGSSKILRKYYETKKPVKFGQCFTFGGVTTTVFRALGVPARTITCFQAAHDSGSSLTIDVYIDDDGNNLSEFSQDSKWNFHVWNEIWTKRPDLGVNYDGWQIVDGTPQELSDNIYRCGPASRFAVKNGEIEKPYDVPYVFAEVNADIVIWKYQGLTQPLKLLQTDTTCVGQYISTKAVGKYEREDLTDDYKFKERSSEERLVMLKALRERGHMLSRYYLNEAFNDVRFEFRLQDDILLGSSYSIDLIARNVSKKDYKVSVVMRTATKKYFGDVENIIKREEKEMTLAGDSEEKVAMLINYEDYAPYICEDCIYQIAALCKIKDIDFEYFAQDDFKMTLPTITIKLEGTPVANQVLYGTAFFKNPLPEKLKNGVFLIEGPGIKKGLKYKIGEVPAHAVAKVNFKMIPTFYGKQTVIAKFVSNKLCGVEGYLTVEVDEGVNNRNDVNSVY